ncbi:MAG: pentapeptide repeat-containing protein [Chloroflexota bacterium]
MAKAGDRPGPPRAIELPPLTPFSGSSLEPHGDYEALLFSGLLAGQRADDASFLACRFDRCGLDDVSMRRAHLAECVLDELHATSLDAADTVWRDAVLSLRRVGALLAIGATWSAVRVRGGRLDLLDLSGGKLRDVAFEGCAIGELDLGTVEARDLVFSDCQIDVLDVTGARLAGTDLTGAAIGAVKGVAGLKGAIVTPAQLLDLAPHLAAHLGIKVRGD